MEKIEKMRKDQELLEERLWKDRMQILKNQEEKVKIAQAKAAIVGNGLDRREVNALESSFSKEIKAFDSDQALLAWDALVAKQQNALEALRVPGMFVTALKTDREKQARIIQVLDGLSGAEDDISVGP
ncbi:hypothetical protein JB92DRAFT_2935951 [Gautieria morchelliformis]|nr:hypothetical protein JB92DRAFT_2935951 [Gautieria morchelliformis]